MICEPFLDPPDSRPKSLNEWTSQKKLKNTRGLGDADSEGDGDGDVDIVMTTMSRSVSHYFDFE